MDYCPEDWRNLEVMDMLDYVRFRAVRRRHPGKALSQDEVVLECTNVKLTCDDLVGMQRVLCAHSRSLISLDQGQRYVFKFSGDVAPEMHNTYRTELGEMDKEMRPYATIIASEVHKLRFADDGTGEQATWKWKFTLSMKEMKKEAKEFVKRDRGRLIVLIPHPNESLDSLLSLIDMLNSLCMNSTAYLIRGPYDSTLETEFSSSFSLDSHIDSIRLRIKSSIHIIPHTRMFNSTNIDFDLIHEVLKRPTRGLYESLIESIIVGKRLTVKFDRKCIKCRANDHYAAQCSIKRKRILPS